MFNNFPTEAPIKQTKSKSCLLKTQANSFVATDNPMAREKVYKLSRRSLVRILNLQTNRRQNDHELHHFGGSSFLIRSDAKLKNSFKADSWLSEM